MPVYGSKPPSVNSMARNPKLKLAEASDLNKIMSDENICFKSFDERKKNKKTLFSEELLHPIVRQQACTTAVLDSIIKEYKENIDNKSSKIEMISGSFDKM